MNKIEEPKRKPHPKASSNWISSLLLLYMVPIFYASFKKDLTENDLFAPLEEHKSDLLGEQLETAWKRYHKQNKKWSLHFALFRVFGYEFISAGFLLMFKEVLFVIFVPYLIGKLVSFFSQTQDSYEITYAEAYYYAVALLLTLVIEKMILHPSALWIMHLAMKCRVACIALIYRKMLKLSTNAQTNVGHVVNLISNDVSKFDQNFPFIHYSWISPIMTAVGIYFLYLQIGGSCFFGLGFLLILLPVQMFIAKRTMVLRLRTALRTDERVRLMNEIITGIQVIKMYVWEKSFAKLVAKIRSKELEAIRANKTLKAVTYAIGTSASRIAIFVSLVGYALLGNRVTAETAFGVVAVYNILKVVVTTLFTAGLSGVAEINVTLNRIRSFLELEEVPMKMLPLAIEVTNQKNRELTSTPKVILKGVSAKWDRVLIENTLIDITFSITTPELFAIIGPVGSGKTSMLNVILSELSIQGEINIDGKTSYCSQDPWLFSASVRENILFGDEYNEKRYREVCKVCQLESDFAQFPHSDKTLVGERGSSLSGGQKARINLARSVYKQADIYLLDDPLSAVDAYVGKKLFNNCIKDYLNGKICILITHQLQYLQHADKILILQDGKMSALGTFTEMKTSGLDFANLLQAMQVSDDTRPKLKPQTSRQISVKSKQSEDNVKESNEVDQMLKKEKVTSGKVTFLTYKNYVKAGGSFFILFWVFGAYVAFEVVIRIGDYFLTYWVIKEDEFSKSMENVTVRNETNIDIASERLELVYEFSGIMFLTGAMGVLCNLFAFYFLMRSSNNLHNYIVTQLAKAKMHFFNTNPVGRILNKFSMDMGIIDDLLPTIIVELVKSLMLLFGTLILTSIVNIRIIPAALILLVTFYLMKIVYVGTSRNIKRIEAIARSPIYNQMTTTMNGLSTIRAFTAQKIAIQQFDGYQDLHSSAWYLFIASIRAFAFWLDLIVVIFLGVVILVLLTLSPNMYGGTLGLIITQYMGLMGSLQWGMRQWSELENQMTSVERVLEYTKLDNEAKRMANVRLPTDWPDEGKLEFKDVSMQYVEGDPPVLKDMNFVVHPGEKVGIVGRTGAGKSSIINSLFQLYDIDGAIFIDNVDSTKLPLPKVRVKVSVIPQEPILFSGTMRKNLDPFDEYDDNVLWNALEQVELKDVVAEMPHGLHTIIAEGGSNYSVGQRQLVCLARAIIRNNRILVLDEATANVDPHTDALIQKTIRNQFAKYTVLTIAHRLHTVMDSDKILVIDAGRVVEFDSPHKLLQRERGLFKDMVQTSGATITNVKN